MYRITNGIYMFSSRYQKILTNINYHIPKDKSKIIKNNTIEVKKSWIPGDITINKKSWIPGDITINKKVG